VATETIPAQAPKTPEEIERHWFEHVYQGDRMPQLTPRAVIMGMLLGAVLSTSNVYVGLKLGWSMGVAITSCISAWVIFATLHRAMPRLFPPYSILENNAMQSCASAAGYMTGAGLVNAIPALMMLDPARLPSNHWLLVPWIIVISWLGVFLAVPAKRQMINIEQLPFPSGIAAATTLRSLHGAGAEARLQARALGLSLAVGSLTTWLRDAEASWLNWYPKIPATWGTSWLHIGRYNLQQLTLSFEGSLLFVAAGAIISFRQAWSMVLGALVNYAILAPIMLDRGIIETASFGRISRWSLWIGVPMMVTSGLLLFFLQWKTVVRAFSSITAFMKREKTGEDPLERIEVPGSWFLGGMLVLGAAAVWLGHWLFQIQIWMGALAVVFTLFLVLVAARATGETDITPTGPLSKITQLSFGAIAPGNITTNLMTANISAGACSHAGDLLTDLKSGYLLGANPRQQFFAQFFGVLAGGLVVVPVFFTIVTSPDVLATERWPAPAALVWRGVAELLSKGVGSLHPTAQIGLLVGATLGIVLPLLEIFFPKHKRFIPSPVGLGIAFTINGFNSVSMFLGACIALALAKAAPKVHAQYTVPISSGIIAGESLMGVIIAILMVRGVLGG
jgi:OPT family oligopeptide transporter